MKKLLSVVLSFTFILSLLAGCASAPAASSATVAPIASTAPPASPTDTQLNVQTPALKDDFYEAVNAKWLQTAEIPSDQPAAGGFMDLSDGVEKVLMDDFAAMLEGTKQPDNPELSSFIEYYRQAADYEARDALGAEPLLPYLEKVEKLTSLSALSDNLAEWDLMSMPLPFTAFVMADMGNAAVNTLYLGAPALFLMDKSYYADEAAKKALQDAYSQMSALLLTLAGKSPEEAAAITAQAIAFDESLAPYTQSAEEASDYTKMYNPVDFKEFDAGVKGFDYERAFTKLLSAAPDKVVLTNPAYFAALDQLVNEETFPAMKSWMMVQTVVAFAPYLSQEMRLASGSFFRTISGVTEPASKEKAAFALASGTFAEVVGVYYGKTYFGAEAKKDVEAMVKSILTTYKERLEANTWLKDSTRALAIKKLDAMSLNLGYPDAPRPIYSQMKTVPTAEGGSLVGNAIAFTSLLKKESYAQWNKPVDRGLWPLSADTVNAMYSPLDNSINFPAAILQAPFYSLEQSASANYGGIGAVIAHEITHAFDPNGAKFDELGNLSDWWTEEDHASFEEQAKAVVAEFDGMPFGEGKVNGTLTLSENVADAGGLACALQAAKKLPDADLKAFFTNWAVIWRQKTTPQYEALLLTMDNHSPNKIRANIQLQNMEDFHAAFGIVEGDGMFRAPEDRAMIW